MAQEEAEVEAGVARMGAFEVEEDQAAGVDQDVLGTEITQDQCPIARRPIHAGDQGLDPGRESRMSPGDRAVVGVDPQFVEQRGVGQGSAQAGVTGRVGVDRPQDRAQRRGDRRIRLTCHQKALPGRRVVGCAGHREQEIGPILEQDARGPSRGAGSSASRSSAARSAQMRSSRAQPFHGHAKSLAALLDDHGAAGRSISTRRTTFETPPLSSRTCRLPGALAGSLPRLLAGTSAAFSESSVPSWVGSRQ